MQAINNIETKIRNLSDKNILKQNFYIIKSIGLAPSGLETSTYSLSDLHTNEGQILPNFEQPPLIIPITESNAQIDVFNITKETFDVGTSSYYGDNDPYRSSDSLRFSLIIMEK